MKIFVFEFVTGGGLAGEPLPPGLVREADLMVRSLLDDLAQVPGVDLLASRDPRLPVLAGVETLPAVAGEDPFALYARGVAEAQAAWPTAPETRGVLECLGRLTLGQGRVLLGCHPDAVRVTASKRATALVLSAAGIRAVPTFGAADDLPDLPGRWVLKPDDGAGSEDTLLVPDWRAARAGLAREGPGFVAQPWIEGDALSLSLLLGGGEARVLSCNRQHVRVSDGRLFLARLGVNAAGQRGREFGALAERIAATIPLLWGHVGVDLIAGPEGPVVLEVNPRLTTSYCGLGKALSINPARLVLDLARTGRLPEVGSPEQGAAVELSLETSRGQ
jgi:predicted ATP-grasp superfamily ATP-dependent carboligase